MIAEVVDGEIQWRGLGTNVRPGTSDLDYDEMGQRKCDVPAIFGCSEIMCLSNGNAPRPTQTKVGDQRTGGEQRALKANCENGVEELRCQSTLSPSIS